MDRVTIADLEAELGCLYQPATESSGTGLLPPSLADSDRYSPATQPHDGPPIEFYEPSPEAITHLETETKVPCLYPFGSEGTIAWVNAAGELVNFASNIKNRLIGIDSKKCLEKGDEYSSRAKVLEEIARADHGYVRGIGLSLDVNVGEPTACWVHNRWPRFRWKQDDLDIQLQYVIVDGSAIQQYQICNNGKDSAQVGYTISSDVTFREHAGATPPYPVPVDQTLDRIMVFQNSMLLIRNSAFDAEFEMGVFNNGSRRRLWAHKQEDEHEAEETPIERFLNTHTLDEETARLERWESMFRADFSVKQRLSQADENYYRHYTSLQSKDTKSSGDEQKDLSQYYSTLSIAPGSTEELCAVVKLSALEDQCHDPNETTDPVPNELHTVGMPRIDGNEQVQEKQSNSVGYSRFDPLVLDGHQPGLPITAVQFPYSKGVVQQLEGQYSVLALQINDKLTRKQKEKAIKKITREEDRLKEREIVLFSMFRGQRGRVTLLNKIILKHISLGGAYSQLQEVGQARFHFFVACLIAENIDTPLTAKANLSYAEFLYANGWKKWSWTVIQKMDVVRMTKGDVDWIRTEKLSAIMRLDRGEISAAEEVYRRIHVQLKKTKADDDPWPELAQVSERIAWTRAKQGRYLEAGSNYTYLGTRPYFSSHRTILSNLAFIKRRLGRIEEARHFYQEALAALHKKRSPCLSN